MSCPAHTVAMIASATFCTVYVLVGKVHIALFRKEGANGAGDAQELHPVSHPPNTGGVGSQVAPLNRRDTSSTDHNCSLHIVIFHNCSLHIVISPLIVVESTCLTQH